MNHSRAVLMDIDGTLLDSAEAQNRSQPLMAGSVASSSGGLGL